MAAEQVYKLNGGFIFRQLSNCFTQTACQNKVYCSVCVSLCMNSGATLYNNTMYTVSNERLRRCKAFK